MYAAFKKDLNLQQQSASLQKNNILLVKLALFWNNHNQINHEENNMKNNQINKQQQQENLNTRHKKDRSIRQQLKSQNKSKQDYSYFNNSQRSFQSTEQVALNISDSKPTDFLLPKSNSFNQSNTAVNNQRNIPSNAQMQTSQLMHTVWKPNYADFKPEIHESLQRFDSSTWERLNNKQQFKQNQKDQQAQSIPHVIKTAEQQIKDIKLISDMTDKAIGEISLLINSCANILPQINEHLQKLRLSQNLPIEKFGQNTSTKYIIQCIFEALCAGENLVIITWMEGGLEQKFIINIKEMSEGLRNNAPLANNKLFDDKISSNNLQIHENSDDKIYEKWNNLIRASFVKGLENMIMHKCLQQLFMLDDFAIKQLTLLVFKEFIKNRDQPIQSKKLLQDNVIVNKSNKQIPPSNSIEYKKVKNILDGYNEIARLAIIDALKGIFCSNVNTKEATYTVNDVSKSLYDLNLNGCEIQSFYDDLLKKYNEFTSTHFGKSKSDDIEDDFVIMNEENKEINKINEYISKETDQISNIIKRFENKKQKESQNSTSYLSQVKRWFFK